MIVSTSDCINKIKTANTKDWISIASRTSESNYMKGYVMTFEKLIEDCKVSVTKPISHAGASAK